ncbi:MAG TPA: hypothetical protein VGQ57_21315, partial [Polyangiaceae bacterium]|nr:hypothetical protein [Polyangiaceae bacterium]
MSTISLRTFSRPWAFALCLIPGALPACIDATETATECSKNISALGGLCPAGTAPKFSTAAHGNCNASGKYEATDESVNASGQCVSDGTCEIDCVPTGMICPCGVASYGHDTVNCRTDCSPGCGDGTCAESETNETCPADCVQPAQDGGGTSADSSATGGAGGSGGDSASGGKGGTSPKGGSGGTTAGTGGAAAGDAAGASGATGNETASSSECNEPKTYGRYLVRDDGALLLVDASGKGSQTAVLDKSTV